MGMDLIGCEWTIDPTKELDKEAIKALLDSITFTERPEWDYNENFDPDDFGEDQEWRLSVLNGLEEYEAACDGHRMSLGTDIGDTGLVFIFAGGGSWGDDPFDGFSSLNLFLCVLEELPGLAELTDFVGGGIRVRRDG